MKRYVLLFFAFVLLIAVSACSLPGASPTPGENAITATFTLTGPEGDALLQTELSLPEHATAKDLVEKACQEATLSYTVSDGFYDNFGGIASTQDAGWLLYINDTLAESGAAEITLTDGDAVAFTYLDYAAAFTLE